MCGRNFKTSVKVCFDLCIGKDGDEVKRTYYKVCEYCGAHLDPGEKCDCGKEDREEMRPFPFQDRDGRKGAA